jgi:N-acetylneuraminic acid mutarotase
VCRHDPPRYLGAVNGATPLADGGTLVSEIDGSWIDDIGPTGRLRWAVRAPVGYPSDPQLIGHGRILLADYSKPGAAIIMTRSGQVLWRYGPSHGPGELDHPSLATRLASGLIAINDDFRDRVVIVSVRAHRIVWQYGRTDTPGTANGYLNTPDGLDLLHTADAARVPGLPRLLSTAAGTRSARADGSTGVRAVTSYALPAPVEREIAVGYGAGILIAGGLDAAEASTAGVYSLDPATHGLVDLGSVPQPFHDAAGAVIGNGLFIFGGGTSTSSDLVQRFDLVTRTGAVVGRLPHPLSDVASASLGGAVYLIGGYDGRTARREIYRTTDGRRFSVVATLPLGLRYPAVATVGSTIVVAGGTSTAGASARVFAFDTRTGNVRELHVLAAPTAEAEAFAIQGHVYLAGGTDATGALRSAVYRIDPSTGRSETVAGSVPLRDAPTVRIGNTVYVLGGSTVRGITGKVRRLALR